MSLLCKRATGLELGACCRKNRAQVALDDADNNFVEIAARALKIPRVASQHAGEPIDFLLVRLLRQRSCGLQVSSSGIHVG